MIYVDAAQIPYGRMKMAHMLADSTEELEAIARKIGLDPKHIEYRGLPNEHVNVSQAYRTKAIKAGAQEISSKGLVRIIRRKRNGEDPPLPMEDLSETPDPNPDFEGEEDDEDEAADFTSDPAPPKHGGMRFKGPYPGAEKDDEDE